MTRDREIYHRIALTSFVFGATGNFRIAGVTQTDLYRNAIATQIGQAVTRVNLQSH